MNKFENPLYVWGHGYELLDDLDDRLAHARALARQYSARQTGGGVVASVAAHVRAFSAVEIAAISNEQNQAYIEKLVREIYDIKTIMAFVDGYLMRVSIRLRILVNSRYRDGEKWSVIALKLR
jgi:hypothetical protein